MLYKISFKDNYGRIHERLSDESFSSVIYIEKFYEVKKEDFIIKKLEVDSYKEYIRQYPIMVSDIKRIYKKYVLGRFYDDEYNLQTNPIVDFIKRKLDKKSTVNLYYIPYLDEMLCFGEYINGRTRDREREDIFTQGTQFFMVINDIQLYTIDDILNILKENKIKLKY